MTEKQYKKWKRVYDYLDKQSEEETGNFSWYSDAKEFFFDIGFTIIVKKEIDGTIKYIHFVDALKSV